MSAAEPSCLMDHDDDEEEAKDTEKEEEDMPLKEDQGREDLPAWRRFQPLATAHPEAASAAAARLESFLGSDDEERNNAVSRTPQQHRREAVSVQPRTEPSRRLFGIVSTVESDNDNDDEKDLADLRTRKMKGTSTDPQGQRQLFSFDPKLEGSSFSPPLTRINLADSFDPYTPAAVTRQSLLDVSAESSASSMNNMEEGEHVDDDDDDDMAIMTMQPRQQLGRQFTPIKNTLLVPGSAGYLEMEEDPSACRGGGGGSDDFESTIQTESGLLLTHRRPAAAAAANTGALNGHRPSFRSRQRHDEATTATSSTITRGPLDIEPAHFVGGSDKRHYLLPSSSAARRMATGNGIGTGSTFLQPPFRSLLRYARLSVACSALLLFFGTAVLWHHTPSVKSGGSVESMQQQQTTITDESYSTASTDLAFVRRGEGDVFQLIPLSPDEDTIVLLPLPEKISRKPRRRLQRQGNALVGIGFQQDAPKPSQTLLHRHLLMELRNQFQQWMVQHGKQYQSESETARRFSIWQHNRHRTATKNMEHGPCLLTGKTVFGDNHLQDLSTHEFRTLYLNGAGRREPMERGSAEDHHHRRTMTVLEPHRRLVLSNGCKWFDVSCNLRYIFSTYLYGLGGTMEPAYDANSYPTAIDWRDHGAVTAVRSQGSCGACWAITAAETIESAVFLATGKLYDLAETEIIVCEDKGTEMCSGGWPQNAFDYVIDKGGLPLSNSLRYDADGLLEMSEAKAENANDNSIKAYQQAVCPANGSKNTRYGSIKGYGYSTSKCVCYTDGSGCNCDKQNEGKAVRNVATYGPAVVCLDASTWQDYTDGILTSASGCSQEFMDVNHCVQAVGYAYVSEEGNSRDNSKDNKNGGKRLLKSNDNSKSGSKDKESRQGYWIVRNQWSSYWGMNGYAYVAMGSNTCGILNDMLQAYT